MQEHILTTNKQKAQKLSRQAAGIMKKVLDMVDQDSYCPEVIQQVDAVVGLLTSAKKELLKGHLGHCLEHRMHENKKQTVDELLKIYNLSR
ncbi:MAG: metal-sensitive transcriptional regulator [Candidatus Paceibacterota bacterium]|jgi:DNA-binding FrmR family transcriptional regulator